MNIVIIFAVLLLASNVNNFQIYLDDTDASESEYEQSENYIDRTYSPSYSWGTVSVEYEYDVYEYDDEYDEESAATTDNSSPLPEQSSALANATPKKVDNRFISQDMIAAYWGPVDPLTYDDNHNNVTAEISGEEDAASKSGGGGVSARDVIAPLATTLLLTIVNV